jgi:hypothetical protein
MALILCASLSAVSVLASIVAVCVVVRRNPAVPDFVPDDFFTGEAEDVDYESEETLDALQRVLELARQDPEFGRAWGMHVRKAADELTATIAGRHMAGQCSGELEWIAHVPTPESMDEDDAHAAFRMAVCAEVTARVNAMTGPGSFG